MSTQHFLRPISQAGRLRPIKFWKSSTIPSRQIGNYAGKTFTVNTGAQIPAIGCRTFQDEEQQEGAVLEALKAGVDLYLLHHPCTFARGKDRFPKGEDGLMRMGETTYVDTWKALQEIMKRTRKARAIGVSNFSRDETKNLINAEMVSFFLVPLSQAYDGGNMNSFYRDVYWSNRRANLGRLLDEPVLSEIGAMYSKNPAHVVLAWSVNHGRSVIPKSTIPWQIRQNVESDFVLEEDMERIDELNADLRFNTPQETYRWLLYEGLD
ncbi:hypothetical protein AN1890.2 [Aspergillus nidulans FGSC A4]|uniref:NADP-dependent oxidoreductase domain-containing protein n=1 Tax=Emericella nidulans (strain FGSC A4 / ATCC 38163 / CBS 112.46 / NRRL 194 / M139) TaxID=227321 RepID=Q5BC40_EMENI|nr:hypothetical protein [Aspergillus nidulans FGSC A4]EAA65055.1 hypothetical protein AN1890.2 [Aspergillus nidulans FGSC A4]CBF85765.1 TPA: conserved hypothetical protein [Aspergillus nidulans FGSC A4]|eukprot:XP_659494.1 hypothetical protein AN1890.2 [Aspergillus nidulans FGSC A4]